MGLAVTTVAAGGLPVTELSAGGIAVTEVASYGLAVTKVSGADRGGMGVTFVSATGGPAVTFDMTWSALAANKNANMGLSSGNLKATPSGTNAAVRAPVGRSSGKYYFEYTSIVTTQLNDFFGLVNSAIGLPSGSAVKTTPGMAGLGGTTIPYVNGTPLNAGGAIGNPAPTSIYIAVDLDADLIWFKVPGISGSGWNSGGIANPATGVGGYSIAALTGLNLVPYCGFIAAAGTQLTANFGASAFVGVVPSGFTSGWPA